jgi:hypothetical protein
VLTNHVSFFILHLRLPHKEVGAVAWPTGPLAPSTVSSKACSCTLLSPLLLALICTMQGFKPSVHSVSWGVNTKTQHSTRAVSKQGAGVICDPLATVVRECNCCPVLEAPHTVSIIKVTAAAMIDSHEQFTQAMHQMARGSLLCSTMAIS